MTAPTQSPAQPTSFIDTIVSLKRLAGPDGAKVRDIVDQLDERAFGLLILLFAIPCLVPGLPGAQIIAIPIFLLAIQMAFGAREVWLPNWALNIRVKSAWVHAIADFTDKRLRWTTRLSKPRLTYMTSGLAERLVGLVCALASVTIMLPITNTIPSLAITLIAVGLLQTDGLFTLAGVLLGAAWTGFLTGLIWLFAIGADFAVKFVSEHLPWIAKIIGH
ncbi:hypothetical protein PbB2_02029 [Candidatus Phycosocius bacilliformis]|uniref:Exopolysaccharide synthesis, ExoD n=1 Tax=Candidatus Phycosocius bacilliformis TaxID=1445552 RepID=A0A2P2EB97_9PROT|nr:exopolysaccharide biosynthesis protein [Candidatus Phycosocius bacilliformis]GBF58348.1 hypothetical protein PbB2_02029 [Candidatus Phycosocius bacilliformis]